MVKLGWQQEHKSIKDFIKENEIICVSEKKNNIIAMV